MNKEEMFRELHFKNDLFPRFVMHIKDSNNDKYEIYKTSFGVKIYKLDWDGNRRKPLKETVLKNIVFPVETT